MQAGNHLKGQCVEWAEKARGDTQTLAYTLLIHLKMILLRCEFNSELIRRVKKLLH